MTSMFSKSLTILCLVSICAASTLAQDAPVSPQLRVKSEPKGVAVSCDGIPQGGTPCDIPNLRPGTHLLTLTLAGYIEERRTVVLTPGDKRLIEFKLKPLQALILVHSEPEGADVSIDGAHKGKTPLLIAAQPLGTYRVNITKAGYQPREVELAATDCKPRKIDVKLALNSANVSVSSQPMGARVLLDGAIKGTTPCAIDHLPAGAYALEVNLKNYFPYTQQLIVRAGQTPRIVVALKAKPSSLMIHSIPEGARVYVNNQRKGVTPFKLEEAEPGIYRVRVEMPGYDADARNITVRPAKSESEEFRLTKNAGSLSIVTEPHSVKVFIDGVEVGTTKPANEGNLSQVYDIELIVQGDHQIQLVREGYKTVTATVTIKRNETAALHKRLPRLFISNYFIVLKDGQRTEGMLVRRYPNGNIRLETNPGIYKTFKKATFGSNGSITTTAPAP